MEDFDPTEYVQLADFIDERIASRIAKQPTLRPLDVTVLRLEPGDVLAVYLPADRTQEQAGDVGDFVVEQLRIAGHANVPVGVYLGDIEVEIIRPGDPDETEES
jgi:hypothetical protein